ncbi:MAG TPA: DUF2199 domain-containing protein [Kiloniellaceae bacterium]|nr:DUF2199 domain-containing protein [Kiloniellaceae bacterium]HIP80298.1 DUF2199 domain-containing protein [Kiloniellaceae bacterium]
MEPFAFTCACCGETVSGLPEIGYDAPAYYHALSPQERETKAVLAGDLCSIDQEDFFIRAVCRVPIVGTDRDFGWGVWVSLSEENFKRYVETFSDTDQSKLGSMFGWFSNALPGYPDTLNLQTTVVPQDNNKRPLVYINDAHRDHPLYIEQQRGLSRSRLAEIYAENLCPQSKGG